MKTKSDIKLYGVFGYPLKHTLSPMMHEAAFRHTGLMAYYLALELDHKHFNRTLKGLLKGPLLGFNITVPYKQKVMPYLNQVAPEARAIRAVNTVYRKRNRWIGTNTDADGFLWSLKEEGKFNPRSKDVLILGAGGASRAVIYGLAKAGARSITVLNRHPEKALKIIRDFKILFPKVLWQKGALKKEVIKEALQKVSLVVNSTSCGLKPKDPVLISTSWIPRASRKKKMLFHDLVYNPEKTPFLRNAKKRGHRTLAGKGMLLYQGALAWQIWTGKRAPIKVMAKALNEALQKV